MPSVKVDERYGQTLTIKTVGSETSVTLTVLAPDGIVQVVHDRFTTTGDNAYDIAQWLVAKNWAVLTEIKTVTLFQSLQIEARREP